MRMGRVLSFLVVISALLLFPPVLFAASKILSNVPVYVWWYGCAPTSGGMVMAYWDSNGYPNLYSGNAQTYDAGTKAMITSTDHANQSGGHTNGQYAWDAGDGRFEPTPCSSADSIACYMQTEPSAGGTYTVLTGVGMEFYADSKGYDFLGERHEGPNGGGTWSWSDFVAEIDADRPVVMSVRRWNGSAEQGHAIVAYGYDTSSGNYMVVHDTWGGTGSPAAAVDYVGHANEPNSYEDGGREYWEWQEWSGANSPWSVSGASTFTPQGGAAPEPSTMALFITGSLLLAWFRKRAPAAEKN